ncbi:MAG TPA: hypothetical protein VMU01_00980 [Rhizomicrobium sp.]|nr:hypothetical protein [Rhizomicrobium sp.]
MTGKVRRWAPIVAAVIVVPPAFVFAGWALRGLGSVPEPPAVSGRILKEATDDFGKLIDKRTGCAFVNNTWNKQAAGNGFRQRVFLEDAGGRIIGGWQWRAPRQIIPAVISQPQIVCGDKPWDPASGLRRDFPFRAADRHLVVDFDAGLRAAGSYNMSFTLWAVSGLPASRSNITHEIMIWNVDSGQPRAGEKIGTVAAGGMPFEVYVEKNHRDDSGSVAFTWTYVAFIAEKPLLKGTLDTGVLTGYLIRRGLLTPDAYLTSLELGNEVLEGSGTVEIRKLDLHVFDSPARTPSPKSN